MHFTRIFESSLLVLIVCQGSRADTLELRDGTLVSGKLVWRGEIAEVITESGTIWDVPKAEVARVTRSEAPPAEAAQAEWASASARIATLDDLKAIISAHQAFLDQFGDQPAAEKAKSSLARYEELLGKSAVKFHGRWMPASDVAALKQAWEQQAQPAVQNYNAGNFKSAIDDANKALTSDANNPIALTILGVAQLQAKDLRSATVSFKTILNSDPADAVALNNLAVISWQQSRPRQAFGYYAQAIAAAPGNRLILDNIAEALGAQGRPGDSLATRLYALWQKNEPAAETQLAQQGLTRWGAVWIDARQCRTLDTMISQNKASLRDAQQQLSSDVAVVRGLNRQLDENDRQYDATEFIEDPDEADLESDRLNEEGDALSSRLRAAEAVADESAQQVVTIQSKLDELFSTRFTGVQRIMRLGDDANPPPPAKVTVPEMR